MQLVHLVQLLLPLYTNAGERQPQARFEQVERELTSYCGGLTSFTRVPARGKWRNPAGELEHDEIVVFEAIVREIDSAWWADYREQLAARFDQSTVIVRSSRIQML